jgi:hypothetical protein
MVTGGGDATPVPDAPAKKDDEDEDSAAGVVTGRVGRPQSHSATPPPPRQVCVQNIS